MALVKRKGRRRSQLHCFCCNKKTGDTSIHHLKPRSEGGTDEPSNLVPLCPECHDAVEGPEDGAWKRIQDRKDLLRREQIKANRRERIEATRKQEEYERNLIENQERKLKEMGVQIDALPRDARLAVLKAKRKAQGYLDGTEAREHHALIWGEESAQKYWGAQKDLSEWILSKVSNDADAHPYISMKTKEKEKSAFSVSALESVMP